jgi:Ca2+-binding RTX toxin-like protein
VIIGAGRGGAPHVKAFDGAAGSCSGAGTDFIDGHQGNDVAFLGAGDDVFQWDPGDGSDLVVGAGRGGGPHVRTSDATFSGGLSVAASDLEGDGSAGAAQRSRVTALNVTFDPAPAAASGQAPQLITGTHLNDILPDVLGWSIVMAGAGNDTIFAPAAEAHDGLTDEYNGGAGIDTVTFANVVGASIEVDLAAGVAFRRHNGTEFGETTLVSIENVHGTALADTIRGDGNANILWGGDGIDTLEGGGGDDIVFGGLLGDFIDGGSGNDSLYGQDGNDTINGGSGNDVLEGGLGNDILIGGSGNDWAHYTGAGAVVVNLTTGTAAGALGVDTLSEIENVRGGSAGDFLTGDGAANRLAGEAGDDTLEGLGGNDFLEGGAGNDFLYGGSGTDTAIYTTNGAVHVNLPTNTATGALGNDTLDSIENVTVYGTGANQLTGNSGANRLEGGDGDDVIVGGNGDDTIYGRGGNDSIRGGHGADLIEGGGGADILRWLAGDLGTDLVRGFQIGVDKLAIDEAFFGANLGGDDTASDVLFAFIHPSGDALLMANSAAVGWTAIARFENTSTNALNAAIQNGTLFHAEAGVLGGGAADQLFF